jgi:hypothetical protein
MGEYIYLIGLIIWGLVMGSVGFAFARRERATRHRGE